MLSRLANVSADAFASLAIRLLAPELNATMSPLLAYQGNVDDPVASTPAVLTLMRLMTPVPTKISRWFNAVVCVTTTKTKCLIFT